MKNFKFVNDVKDVLDKFGPEILTGFGIIFTGLAIKSAIDKAEEATNANMECKADCMELEQEAEVRTIGSEDLKKSIKSRKLQKNIELVMIYKWSLIFGVASAACVICSNRLSGSKLAAAYALAKLNEDKLKIALAKTKELLGEDGEKTIKDTIAEELAVKTDAPLVCTKNPELNQPEVFIDEGTGAWMKTTMENMEAARQKAISELQKNHVLSYKRWLTILGYPYEELRRNKLNVNNQGWNTFHPFDIKIVQLSEKYDGRPMYRIEYKNDAQINYREMTK